MLLYARKKNLRDDRILQLVLLMSLLRGSSDLLLGMSSSLGHPYEHDHSMGPALGQTGFSPIQLAQELHPKSLDRILARYQFSVFQDLNFLGLYSQDSGRMHANGNRNLDSSMFRNDIQAYLLNAEASLASVSENPSAEPPLSINTGSASSSTESESLGINLLTDEEDLRPFINDLFEDLDFLDTISKHETDNGAANVPLDSPFLTDDGENDVTMDSKITFADPSLGLSSKDFDYSGEPFPGSEVLEIAKNRTWSGLENVTVHDEVELSANCSVSDQSSELLSPPSTLVELPTIDDSFDFNLDDVLSLAGLDVSSPLEQLLKDQQSLVDEEEADSGCGESAVSSEEDEDGIAGEDPFDLHDTLDQMIHSTSLLQHQHDSSFDATQARLGGLAARAGGSMEQRWQDLASWLSVPSPEGSAHATQSPPTASMAPLHASHGHHHSSPALIHHPHALYPSHDPQGACSPPGTHAPRGILLHNATLPPPLHDHHNSTYPHNVSFTNSMGVPGHLSAGPMNVNSSCESQNQTTGHPYKMEVPPSAASQEMMYYQQNCTSAGNPGDIQTGGADGFLSTLLNDEDLQLMDIPPPNEYSGSRSAGEFGGPGSYRFLQGGDDPHRMAPVVVAQKKHQMYGKRFLHDQNIHGGVVANLSGASGGLPLGNPSYSPAYGSSSGPPHMEVGGPSVASMNTSEMKYSYSMDFRADMCESGVISASSVHHNHTYHQMSGDGPSGVTRPKDRKARRSEGEKHLTRDEKRALALNLPITCEDIINLPMDEFNERISKFDLTEAQLSLIRDIRRRGKNKVAAQNCRKRKLDQIVHLAEEVKVIHYRKSDVISHLDRLRAERSRLKHKFSLLYRHVFQALRDADGNPYSPHEFALEQSADGNVVLVPRRSSQNAPYGFDPSPHGHNETELH